MPYCVLRSVLEYMYDGRDANYGQRCHIVESLLQFSEPRLFKFSWQNCNKLLHNTKCGMKWCFGWHKWWATWVYSITYRANEWSMRRMLPSPHISYPAWKNNYRYKKLPQMRLADWQKDRQTDRQTKRLDGWENLKLKKEGIFSTTHALLLIGQLYGNWFL